MTLRPIITPGEVGELSRPCYTEEATLERIIAEAEREDLKPRLGDRLYLALKQDQEEMTSEQRLLLLGGEWVSADGRVHYLTGIKTALAYFAYSRVIRDGNIQATRYGARVKNDDNSIQSEREERQRHYRQAFSSADAYLAECLAYVRVNADVLGIKPRAVRANRTSFRVIGADVPKTQVATPVQGAALGLGCINLQSESIRVEGTTLIFEPKL